MVVSRHGKLGCGMETSLAPPGLVKHPLHEYERVNALLSLSKHQPPAPSKLRYSRNIQGHADSLGYYKYATWQNIP
jgi:hypothetical protein